MGLIFLSAMASDIALRLTGGDGEGGEGGAGEDVGAVALGSSLLVMTVCTAVVGLLTMLVGEWRWLGTLVVGEQGTLGAEWSRGADGCVQACLAHATHDAGGWRRCLKTSRG